MKTSIKILFALGVLMVATSLTSCNSNESYANMLNDERHAVNAFMANFQIKDVPADSVFEVGENAPYYKLDDEGNVYMQVLKTGDRKNNKARKSQYIYFRYTRYNLDYWYNQDHYWVGSGNADDMSANTCYFLYNDYTLTVSSQWGYGLQMPLDYLGIDCEVNLVIKSQYGWTDEYTNVTPYMYHVRYFPSKI